MLKSICEQFILDARDGPASVGRTMLEEAVAAFGHDPDGCERKLVEAVDNLGRAAYDALPDVLEAGLAMATELEELVQSCGQSGQHSPPGVVPGSEECPDCEPWRAAILRWACAVGRLRIAIRSGAGAGDEPSDGGGDNDAPYYDDGAASDVPWVLSAEEGAGGLPPDLQDEIFPVNPADSPDELDDFDDPDVDDYEERCSCGRATVGETCGCCGRPLCPMCFECSGGFCSGCPTDEWCKEQELERAGASR